MNDKPEQVMRPWQNSSHVNSAHLISCKEECSSYLTHAYVVTKVMVLLA